MAKENTTLALIDMLANKYKLDRQKVINYIADNASPDSFKLFLSGFMFDLSVNANNIQSQLS